VAGFGKKGKDPAGYDRIRSLIRPDLTRSRGLLPEFGNGDRTLPDFGDNFIFNFRNFFV
jgi:hypothetical protein